MARDYRTLKLEILAETKQFVADMKKSETQVEGFGGKMEKFGKMAAAAFAAAAAAAVAYAGKLAVDGVKAACECHAPGVCGAPGDGCSQAEHGVVVAGIVRLGVVLSAVLGAHRRQHDWIGQRGQDDLRDITAQQIANTGCRYVSNAF